MFANKPLPLSELTRIASDKIRKSFSISEYINILDIHYFKEYNVYVVLFEKPVFLNVISEDGLSMKVA